MVIKQQSIGPTDWACLVSLIALAILFGVTREADLKAAFLGLVAFFAGRVSHKNSGGLP